MRFESGDTSPNEVSSATTLFMRAEYGSDSPLWTEHGGYVDLEDLPLDATLRKSLQEWALSIPPVLSEDDDPSTGSHWRADGRSLYCAAAEQLRPTYTLIWDMEPIDVG